MGDGRPLAGRVAIVTGAGREGGIGRAAAVELARLGADVVVTDLACAGAEYQVAGRSTAGEDEAGLDDAVAAIETSGGRGLGLAVDVTKEPEVQAAVARTVNEFGGVDILFNNAGTPVGARPFFELTDEAWDLSWRVNVMGMVYCCRAVAPRMKARGGGSIINNASLAGLRGAADLAGYTTTKFAVIGLTVSLALDLAADGIRVNAVCPGHIETPMTRAWTEVLDQTSGVPHGVGPSDDAIPLGRAGRGEDVGSVVAWLAGAGARYVTGASIPVDGGFREGL